MVCRQFNALLSFIGTDMGGDDLVFEVNSEGLCIGFNNDLSADGPRWDGVTIDIKADGEIGIDLC